MHKNISIILIFIQLFYIDYIHCINYQHFLNWCFSTNYLKPIYQVSLGQISAVWNIYFSSQFSGSNNSSLQIKKASFIS